MIKVKEYLDKNLFPADWNSEHEPKLKSNGHYCVHGDWEYPKGISQSEGERFTKLMETDSQFKRSNAICYQ